MESGQSERSVDPWWARRSGAAALIAALGAIVYARSLANAFSYDEGLVIIQAREFLRSGAIWTLVSKEYFAVSLEGTWRPMSTLSYMLDARLALHPAVFRAQSLLWHVGSSLLVTELARRLLPAAKRRFALVAGLVFALHPVTTEVVDNSSFREDSLATFFTLATLLLALRGKNGWSLLSYALALLSKESAVVAPALLASFRLAGPSEVRRSFLSTARELVLPTLITLAYLAIRFGPLDNPAPYANYPGGSLGATLLGVPAIWAHYLRLLIWPWPLCADYTGYFRFGTQPVLPVLGSLLVVVAFAIGVVLAARHGRRRGTPLLALGLVWFAVALVPVSNFVPVPIPAAERFLYLPLAGIALSVAAVAGLLSESLSPQAFRGVAFAGAGVLAVFAVLVNLRHAAWRTDDALWIDTVARNPRSCGAQSAIGGKLLSRGMKRQDSELFRRAAAQQELALSLCADGKDDARQAVIYTRLGAARAMLEEVGLAEQALERAMDLAPDFGLAVVWLGYVRFLEGDKAGAAALLRRAIVDLGPPDAAVSEVARRYQHHL